MPWISAQTLARVVAIGLTCEALFGLLRIGRVASALVVYGPVVLSITTLRGLVTALEFVAARVLWTSAPGGIALARAALLFSAVLRVFETGWRLAPSSLQPGLEWFVVGAYAGYAWLAWWALRMAALRR